jgi:hypothetical protein
MLDIKKMDIGQKQECCRGSRKLSNKRSKGRKDKPITPMAAFQSVTSEIALHPKSRRTKRAKTSNRIVQSKRRYECILSHPDVFSKTQMSIQVAYLITYFKVLFR